MSKKSFAVIALALANFLVLSNAHGSCFPSPSGLVAWWKVDGNTQDQITGNPGTLIGNAKFTIGYVGGGLSLDGSASLMTVGNPTALQLQTFTIEAWIKRASASFATHGPNGDAVLFGYGNDGYVLGLNDNGRLFLGKIGVGGISVSTSILDTNFHHVAVSKSGSTIIFYADGVAYPAAAYDPGFQFYTEAAMGGRSDDHGSCFIGLIDELAVFNRALASNEIRGIFLAGSDGKCLPQTAPTILAQPSSVGGIVGNFASFSVTAAGAPPLSYQWFKDGTILASGTSSTLNLSSIGTNDAGGYSVIITNLYGAITSTTAILTVIPSGSCYPPPSGLVGWWKLDGGTLDQTGGATGDRKSTRLNSSH